MREPTDDDQAHDARVLDLCLAAARLSSRRMTLTRLLTRADDSDAMLVRAELRLVDDELASVEEDLRGTLSQP